MEQVLSYIAAEALVLAESVSNYWFVFQPYITVSAFCNILGAGSVPQNITTTDCGSTLFSNLVFISEYVITYTTLLITEFMTGAGTFLC